MAVINKLRKNSWLLIALIGFSTMAFVLSDLFGRLVTGGSIPRVGKINGYKVDVQEFENRVLQLGPDNVAAFIAEPLMGAGGVLVAPRNYHQRMWEICQKYDVLLHIDEVVCGLGRTGRWFGYQHYDIRPDIVTLAKGLTSAYAPLSASIISEKIFA